MKTSLVAFNICSSQLRNPCFWVQDRLQLSCWKKLIHFLSQATSRKSATITEAFALPPKWLQSFLFRVLPPVQFNSLNRYFTYISYNARCHSVNPQLKMQSVVTFNFSLPRQKWSSFPQSKQADSNTWVTLFRPDGSNKSFLFIWREKIKAWVKRHARHQHLNSCVCNASSHRRMNAETWSDWIMCRAPQASSVSTFRATEPFFFFLSTRTWDRPEWPHWLPLEEQYEPLMKNKGRVVSALDDDEGQKRFQVSQRSLTTTRPRPGGGNCCVTAHMNTPKSALGLVRSGKVHYSDNQRHTISIARPHGNSNCRCDCMESGVSDNLSHVKTGFHQWAEDWYCRLGFKEAMILLSVLF